MAINLSPEGLIRYYPKFPWAIPNQRVGSHALLTRLPLSIAGAFDLHVLGLPPAFVLSQDQTLKLKADSGWLGGYSKESLRNGHLHTKRPSSSYPEGPGPGAYGDGLKRRDRQSSASTLRALARPSDPPGLRRLRFPFFYALVKEQGIAVSHPLAARSAFAAPLREERTRLGVWRSQTRPRVYQEIAALSSGASTWRREMGVDSRDTHPLSTPRRKYFDSSAKAFKVVTQMPQIGPLPRPVIPSRQQPRPARAWLGGRSTSRVR